MNFCLGFTLSSERNAISLGRREVVYWTLTGVRLTLRHWKYWELGDGKSDSGLSNLFIFANFDQTSENDQIHIGFRRLWR